METHSSILAWIIPWTEEPGGLQSTGSQRVRNNGRDLACMHVQNRKDSKRVVPAHEHTDDQWANTRHPE